MQIGENGKRSTILKERDGFESTTRPPGGQTVSGILEGVV